MVYKKGGLLTFAWGTLLLDIELIHPIAMVDSLDVLEELFQASIID